MTNKTYIRRYLKEHNQNLRFRFNGSETIETNYSQAFQDIFVLSMLNGKRNGTYVEIGGNHGTVDNNTYLLESLFDWKGVAVEIVPELVKAYNSIRRNQCVCANAVELDYGGLLVKEGLPAQIDYLQVDIEPARQTFNALKKVLESGHRFSVITFETDAYSNGTEPQKDAMHLLATKGYDLVVKDVNILDRPFEDWYVDPSVISKDMIDLFKSRALECSDCVLKI